jgi:hypothetical protein
MGGQPYADDHQGLTSRITALASRLGHEPATTQHTVILRCSPFFTASLEGWTRAPASAAILRDAAQARGSSE